MWFRSIKRRAFHNAWSNPPRGEPRYPEIKQAVLSPPAKSRWRCIKGRRTSACVPVRYAAFDTLVMTWTLCSIPNPRAALHEMQRVLKPGGCLLFVEHGLSQEPRIIRWQHRLTPCWKRIGGGCHLDRNMDDLIRAAGFRVDALETGYMKGPKPWTFMYRGSATR